MKKLLTIILVLSAMYSNSQDTIKYTPMTAAGYRFKYFVSDSGHTLPFKDTALDRGTTRPGSLVCYTGDSAVYWWNGLMWSPIGSNVTTGTITSGIDSATFYNGTLCFWTEGASQCYDLSRYFCQSGYNYDTTKILFYNCDGDLVDSLKYPISYVDVDYPLVKRRVGDTTYFGIAEFNGQSTVLIGGLVSYDTLYTYDVTGATYSINGVQYTSAAGFTTLEAADGDFDRQDIIALDTNGTIINITGTPGADPLLPQVDPLSQIFLTSVYVKAGSTAPDNIVREEIYDENVESWTRTITAGLTVNPDNIVNPYHLVKSLDVGTWAVTKTITFTRVAGVIPAGTYGLFKMFIKLKAPLPANASIRVIFYNTFSSQQPGTSTLTAAHGFDRTSTGYQNITMAYTGAITAIQIVFVNAGSGAYVDYVQLQGGITNGNSNFITNVFRKAATDSVFQVINGGNVFAFKDSIGGASSSSSQFTSNLLIYTNTLTPTGVLANEAAFLAALKASGPGDNNDSVAINGFRIVDGSGAGQVGLIEISISRLIVIPAGMFRNNTEITGFVDMGSLLSAGSEIRQAAFRGATNLRFFSSLLFGDIASSNVGDSAFYGCTNLSSVYLPAWNSNSTTSVFQNCPALNNLTVRQSGDAVTFIEAANSFDAKVLANVPSEEASVTGVYEEIISTASQTTFSFTSVPTSSSKYMVYVNGAAVPKTYYSVSTNDIIFSAGLVDGDSVVLQGIE